MLAIDMRKYKELMELMQEEESKYPEFSKTQLVARARARILSDYGFSDEAKQYYAELDAIEKREIL